MYRHGITDVERIHRDRPRDIGRLAVSLGSEKHPDPVEGQAESGRRQQNVKPLQKSRPLCPGSEEKHDSHAHRPPEETEIAVP